jgi:orotidine-5'-phosphate decarboxylase
MPEAAVDDGRTSKPDVRNRLVIALDTDDLVEATRIARELRPWFGVAKVGLELFSAVGPDAVISLCEEGYRIFLDLKLHDIPTTVRKAAQVCGGLGASDLTLHAAGGPAMLRAGVEGFLEGAVRADLDPPVPLAVTILTSDVHAPAHLLQSRVRDALDGGCRGIVCAASDVHDAKQLAPRLTAVVPGIRPAGTNPHDQARAATPDMALEAGADLLVIGRAVTAAPDRAEAAAMIVGSLALERRQRSEPPAP